MQYKQGCAIRYRRRLYIEPFMNALTYYCCAKISADELDKNNIFVPRNNLLLLQCYLCCIFLVEKLFYFDRINLAEMTY